MLISDARLRALGERAQGAALVRPLIEAACGFGTPPFGHKCDGAGAMCVQPWVINHVK